MATLVRLFFRHYSHGNFSCKDAGKPHGHMNLLRFLSLGIALPTILLLSFNNFKKNRNEEENHPEFVPYEYLNIRNKRWPWGDGNTPLFYNPKKNRIPTSLYGGYEDIDGGDSNDAEDLGTDESTETGDDSLMKKCEEIMKQKEAQSQIKAETEDKCRCGESAKK